MRPTEKQRLLKIAIAKETLRKVKSGEPLNNISAKQVVSHYDGSIVDVSSSGQVTRIEDLGSTNVARAVDEIVITWRKTAESFIETALLLKRYKSYSNWRDIEKELEKSDVFNFLHNKKYKKTWSGVFSHIFQLTN